MKLARPPLWIVLGWLVVTSFACASPRATAGTVNVTIEVDDQEIDVSVPAGSTVRDALETAGISINPLDEVDPPGYTVVQEGTRISVHAIEERFEIEEVVIPFQRQTVRNEGLPEGETRLLQPGKNGLQEITYRVVSDGEVEISRTPVKTVVIVEPIAEIVMVGAETNLTPLPITGNLAYIAGGNAWLVEGNSGNRKAVVVSGDLDGRVLKVSPDRDWLLYSRAEDEDPEVINSLWVQSLADSDTEPIELEVENVVHFADWVPGANSSNIAYSTVESSPSPPGWQANNDLWTISISSSGRLGEPEQIIEANAGGQYGWWGTDYQWGWNETDLAYMRADSIGWVDLESQEVVPIMEITPFQTLGDWAWVPSLAWSHDLQSVYFVDHGMPVGLEDPQASPVFNIVAQPGTGGPVILADRAGMFASPVASPLMAVDTAEIAFDIAYLSAISPLESEGSSYRLMVMDRDGSNPRELFPPPGDPGLDPFPPVWSPDADQLAVIYRGDLWIVDVQTATGQKLTGDAQTIAVDWQ